MFLKAKKVPTSFHSPMINNIIKFNKKLIDILSPKRGYFGHVIILQSERVDYEYIGYEMIEDFCSVLENMTEKQRKTLLVIINYFEIHASPMKKMLNGEFEGQLLFSKIAWSHFMTIIMFGMLEVAVKGNNHDLPYKKQNIKRFLEKNLSEEVKEDISKRYSLEKCSRHKKNQNFSDVIDDLWYQIRSSFIHDAGIEFKGLENFKFGGGIGTEKNPITIKSDVSMQELLKITWQAILNSYGYKGDLKTKKY